MDKLVLVVCSLRLNTHLILCNFNGANGLLSNKSQHYMYEFFFFPDDHHYESFFVKFNFDIFFLSAVCCSFRSMYVAPLILRLSYFTLISNGKLLH